MRVKILCYMTVDLLPSVADDGQLFEFFCKLFFGVVSDYRITP